VNKENLMKTAMEQEDPAAYLSLQVSATHRAGLQLHFVLGVMFEQIADSCPPFVLAIQYERLGKKFVDEDFPAGPKALFNDPEAPHHEAWKDFEWCVCFHGNYPCSSALISLHEGPNMHRFLRSCCS
jgi:hypothetical protein